jgi:hypothetical protein
MALAILRTLQLTVSNIEILFSDDLDPNIGIANVSIISNIDSVNDPEIISVVIENDILNINFRPLFPNVQYKIVFKSTDQQPFQTINGDRITEDGTRNSLFITSPGENESPIRDSMLEVIPEVYETEQPSLVRTLITSLAGEIQRTADVLDTVEASNYLSILVEDERIVRDDGPVDKFSNGGVFEVLRVARVPTGASVFGTLEFNEERYNSFQVDGSTIINTVIKSLTADPISLQSIDVINEQVSDNIDNSNFFDGLKIKVANGPIIQVISVTLKRDDELIPYDIERFGYTLNSNRYDTLSASTNVTLSDRELELSSSSITGLTGGFLTPQAGDSIFISYVHKKLGRIIDDTTVELSSINNAVREPTSALLNSFSLKHAPIVDIDDEIPIRDGVVFLNTQAIDGNAPFSITHPAFVRELKFDPSRLPSRAGEYSINYETGEVLVFGADQSNDGTGSAPPAATYTYRQLFIKDLDFTFNSDRNELVINSTRNIDGIEAKIRFKYEDTFAKDTDYRELFHVEALNERVDNRLIADFKIQTLQSPITNAFRIFNETTGEIYSIVRFNDTSITFSGRQAPRQKDITRERVAFVRVPQETLLISDDLENSSNIRVLKVNLQNNNITDANGRFIGANFDTSASFSRTDLFIREKFYEDRLFNNIDTNIDRLQSIGDYSVDYTNGIVYVAVSDDQNSNIGDVTYQYGDIQTRNAHILGVNNIYRSASALRSNIKNYAIGDITDTTVGVIGLEQVGERFLEDDASRVILVGTYQSGTDGVTSANFNIFTSNSAIFTTDDLQRTLTVGSESNAPIQDVIITGIINTHQVTVDQNFTDTLTARPWTVLDLSEGAPKTITLANNILSIKNIYSVEQLGNLSASELDGYFDVNRDTFNANVITLGETNPLNVGDAVIVNYNYGDLFIDYRYLQDELLVSYEYGNNSLDWSISGALNTGEEYFATYKYGALREALLSNFGSLTQIPQLTNFSQNLDREIYRSIVGGTLQSFIQGPTIPSMEKLVEAFTDVTPEIREFAFNNWILGRDFLNLRKIESSTNITFDLGKFDKGVSVDDSDFIKVPALAHLKLNEGTIEAWVRPNWNGLTNDSTFTFDISINGVKDPSAVYIGFSAVNPTEIPFSIDIFNTDISVFNEPSNIDDDITGYFIWFDEFANQWNIRWKGSLQEYHLYEGTISTSGEFYNVIKPTGSDGYSIDEISDLITSSIKTIRFSATIDLHEDGDNSIDGGEFTDTTISSIVNGGAFNTTSFLFEFDGGSFLDTEFSSEQTSGFSLDGITFSSGDTHYLFDMLYRDDANRMSIFKDGTGYLNFHVIDNRMIVDNIIGSFNLSSDVSSWKSGELHQIAASWRFNSDYEKDEMHLFIDGEEVPNLFKYGGNPKATSDFDFGNVAEETVIESATRPIVGNYDGSTLANSSLFISETVNFADRGIEIGDSLIILENSPDGEESPNLGAPYTVTGVGSNTITVDRDFTQTLGNIHFTINQVITTVDTPINFQDFILVTTDTDGNSVELKGIDADQPDYSVRRGADNTHVITINNGISLGDKVVIKTLGLIFRQLKERIFVYGSTDEIRLLAPAPVTLGDVKITSVLIPKNLISANNGFSLVNTFIGPDLITLLEGQFDGYYSVSNSVSGRRLSVRLSGDNIDYTFNLNTVTIIGEAFSGASFETITFTENDTMISSEYWITLNRIEVSVIPIDTTKPAGLVEVKEYKPLTESENNGDFAEVVKYSNGVFKLEVYGSGGMEFIISQGYYDIEYPTFLRIRFDSMPDSFLIGTDANLNNQFDGIIDEFRILDNMQEDTRIGETISSGESSITVDYNTSDEFEADNNTLLLMHFNDDVEDSSIFMDRFDTGFEVAPSVNNNFISAIRFENNRPYIVSNAGSIFNNDEGTIEFWIKPLDDTKDDPNYHYFIDMSAIVEEQATSSTNINVITTQRIRTVESVRLASDIFNTGTNYFTGGSISNVDGKTITLGIPLPAQNVDVKIVYVPLNANGDRVSIFRDPSGFINFFVKASGVEHLLSVHVDWDRHTWHRVMVMWRTNRSDNLDRLRLFVDGSEKGTIKYGTGLIYGTGVIYGQAEVRPGVNRFIVDNIDLTDTFSKIFIGTDVLGFEGARSLMDNIRFSSIERLQSIRVTTNDTIDVNYVANTEFALPVVEDDNTTAIFNFDKDLSKIEFLVTLINAERGIFRFEIDVIDSFDKVIGNTQLEELLVELINILKPAHTEAIIKFIK